jgi:hypothetical protein
MLTLILVFGVVVAIAAAVRSTWSPCGVSMLSTITPFGERSRGHRYTTTAAWYVAGATVGGATLGAFAAGLAAMVAVSGIADHPGWIAAAVALAAATTAAIDAGVFGDLIPIWRRQVDDRWLVRYRNWVYGSGFGWQIGVGVATYIMTAAVFLVVVLAAVTGDPVAAFAICVLFGFARGLTVLLPARAESPARLRTLHRRFDRAGPGVRVAVIAVQAGVALAVIAVPVVQWPLAAAAAGLAAAGVAVVAGVAVSRAARAWTS